ncbi:hypothetical protein Tco_1068647 [Tanacetum coccineum]|uniref:Retrotransposon gag domain-containing protein n=1 Tax=Tanacetum coccineum TaxID=301880 RepID=A0ABQ5HGA4_9ASTR
MTYPPLWLEGLPFELEWDLLSNYTIRSSNSFEWHKIIFRMITSMGIRHAKAYILRGRPSMKLEQRLFKAWQLSNPLNNPSISSKLDRAHICIISGTIHNEKELWDSRRHQTGKETGGEGMPKVLGLRRSKQGKGGHQPSTNMGGNLPPNGTLLSHHAQPFIHSSLHIPTGLMPIHVNPYPQPSANLVHEQAPNFPFETQMGNRPAGGTFAYHPQEGYIPQAFTNNSIPSYNGPMHPTITPSSNYPFYTQPMYAPPNISAYPNPAGPFVDFAGLVTPFVRWIEDYPLPNRLKMPSHIGSYDGKGDPDNFLHLFEGAIRMQKWLMLVACHMFTYTLKDYTRIWWNSQKIGGILNNEELKAKFRSHFSQQKKFTKTHLAVHNIKQREGERTRAFITRYTDDTLQILDLHEEQ